MKTNPYRRAHAIGAVLVGSLVLLSADGARAEINIAQSDGWTVYINGRVNAFFSRSQGDALPTPQDHMLVGGGVVTDLDNYASDPVTGAATKFSISRVKSGFLGNIFGVGFRKNITERTTLEGYFAFWSTIESNRQRFASTPIDVREGYMKLKGPWGSFLAGRALGLFSRGHVEIDFLYAHGFGMGFPCTESGGFGGIGPACGQIGFGVIFPFFASGLVYSTPDIYGFSATAGMYEPALVAGHWDRTPLPRFEGELAYDRGLGNLGKVHLFGTGVWQQLGEHPTSRTTNVSGFAGGGRVEVGPLRLGGGYYTGKGLGFSYAIENSPALYNSMTGNLRTFDGFFGQLMLALGIIDIAGGAGQGRLHLLAEDAGPMFANTSFIKTQTGFNGGVFYHANKYIVVGADFFQARFKWSLGDQQTVNTGSLGVTFVW